MKINEITVEKVSELQEQISRYSPGDKIIVWAIRDGNLKKFFVELKNSLGTTDLVNKNIIEVLGATFSEVAEGTKKELNIESGVEVSDIQSGKLLRAGVKKGFIITHINREKVNSPKDIQDLLKDTHGGVYLQGVYPDGNVAYYAFGLE